MIIIVIRTCWMLRNASASTAISASIGLLQGAASEHRATIDDIFVVLFFDERVTVPKNEKHVGDYPITRALPWICKRL